MVISIASAADWLRARRWTLLAVAVSFALGGILW